MSLIICFELFLSWIAITEVTTESASISVALYNYIPDLNDDNLTSYKQLVKTDFETSCDNCEISVTVDNKHYDPYSSDLKEDLTKFDVLEIDAVTLGT